MLFARSSRCVVRLCVVWAFTACTPTPVATAPESGPAASGVELTQAPTASAVDSAPSAQPSAPGTEVDAIAVAIAAPDRSEADRALDAGRHPQELLNFFQIRPGMQVAELAAGMGYTAELLARVVGPSGKVYGHNTPFLLKRFAEGPWSERLQKPINANIVRVNREFDAPFPPEAKNLDAVLMVLFYHDTVWQKVDRPKMNRAIFDALKPGGVYGIVDHRTKEGQGLTQVETLHRIEESIVRKEVEAAGFILDAEATFMQNPNDTKDWSASPRVAGEQRGTSDRFVLRYKRPAQ